MRQGSFRPLVGDGEAAEVPWPIPGTLMERLWMRNYPEDRKTQVQELGSGHFVVSKGVRRGGFFLLA